MGITNHNAILATTMLDRLADAFQAWIGELSESDQQLFVRAPCTYINGFHTFVMVPDGSNEGWEDSDRYNVLRQMVCNRLEADKLDDGSSCWYWVEVGYGEYGQKVLRGNNENCFSDSTYADDMADETAPTVK